MSLKYFTDKIYNKILKMTSRFRIYVMVSKVYHNILVSSLLVLVLVQIARTIHYYQKSRNRSVNLVLWLIFNNIANVKKIQPLIMAKSYPMYHAIIKLAFTLCDDASRQVSGYFFLQN